MALAIAIAIDAPTAIRTTREPVPALRRAGGATSRGAGKGNVKPAPTGGGADGAFAFAVAIAVAIGASESPGGIAAVSTFRTIAARAASSAAAVSSTHAAT